MRAIETLVAEGRNGARTSKRDAQPEPREVLIRIRTTPQVVALLQELARSGLYPPDAGEVAEELLREKLRELEAR
jgi:hypothetical protein